MTAVMIIKDVIIATLLRGFFYWFSGFPPSIKINASKFQFDLDVEQLNMSPWLGSWGPVPMQMLNEEFIYFIYL